MKHSSLIYVLGVLLSLFCQYSQCNELTKIPGVILVECPTTVAGRLNFTVKLSFATKAALDQLWSTNISYTVKTITPDGMPTLLLQEGIFNPYLKDETSLQVFLSINLGPYAGYVSGEFPIYIHLEGLTLAEPSSKFNYELKVFAIPAWLSILPSLVTVILAIALRQNILALFVGVWLGATFLNRYNPVLGLFRGLDTLVIKGIVDVDHASVIYFCLVIGGMIAVIGKGGGATGLANLLKKRASTKTKSMLATWTIGVLTFFDDYASCLISGSTMRDSTGALNISREKLSFIVDTCAATVSSLMVISSWIGIELSSISTELKKIADVNNGASMYPDNSYEVFLCSIPYRAYPLLVLFFSLMNILLKRDFGPMLTAERRAFRTGKLIRDGGKSLSGSSGGEYDYLNPKEGKPTRWFNAIIPFVLVVLIVVGGMIWEGYYKNSEQEQSLLTEIKFANDNGMIELKEKLTEDLNSIKYNLKEYFSKGNSFHGLIWASFIGSAVAIILVLSQGILTLDECMDAWIAGTKTMLIAILILMHAWALSITCTNLYTSDFIASGLKDNMNAGFLPTITFLMAAIMSFSTGSAFGTMALLFPLMVPLAFKLDPGNLVIMLGTISSILAGAVWGNHTSPVSDSCIMSSTACAADHTDHVKTQAVYAVTVGFIAIVTCILPVGFELYQSYVGLLIGAIIIILLLLAIGRRPEDPDSVPMPIVMLMRKYTPALIDGWNYSLAKMKLCVPEYIRIWYHGKFDDEPYAPAALDEENTNPNKIGRGDDESLFK